MKLIARDAVIAQSVERVIGNDEVGSSNLPNSSTKSLEPQRLWGFPFFCFYKSLKKLIQKLKRQVRTAVSIKPISISKYYDI